MKLGITIHNQHYTIGFVTVVKHSNLTDEGVTAVMNYQTNDTRSNVTLI